MVEAWAETGKGKFTEKQEGGLVRVKPIRVCSPALVEVRLLPSHRGCETRRSSIFRGWLKQTGNSFGGLEFSQAAREGGLESSQGCGLERLEIMLVLVPVQGQVCSSSRPRLGSNGKEGSEEPGSSRDRSAWIKA